MRKRKYVSLDCELSHQSLDAYNDSTHPVPQCHNIVSTSQISISCTDGIDLSRLAHLFPFTSYDRKRFAAITVRLGNPQCTCLLFGSGKLVITGSTSYYACVVASQSITQMLRKAYPLERFSVVSCVVQNIVAHVEFPRGTGIDLDNVYEKFCECTTYQRHVFPGLVLRPPQSPIVLLIFNSGRIVCTGGRSYEDIYRGFAAIYRILKVYIHIPSHLPSSSSGVGVGGGNSSAGAAVDAGGAAAAAGDGGGCDGGGAAAGAGADDVTAEDYLLTVIDRHLQDDGKCSNIDELFTKQFKLMKRWKRRRGS